jgi:cytochrome c-type biogenesis protein
MVSVLLSPCHVTSTPLLIANVAGQEPVPNPRKAALFTILFAVGIFITITAIGLICATAGRMLGDVGVWWQSAVGVLLLWVLWSLFKPPACSTSASSDRHLKVHGPGGALVMGLVFGILAGICTFGFIAPILDIISLQREITT